MLLSLFSRRKSKNDDDDYWDALKKLGLYSLERRRDRYRVIYLWKTIEGLVPPLGLNPTWNPRRGRTVKPVDVARNAATWVRNAKAHSFRYESVRMWNLLPIGIRNTTHVSVDAFKRRLDKYLTNIPDQPRLPSLTSQCITTSNCLLEMIPVSENARFRSVQSIGAIDDYRNEGGATLTSLH